MADLLVQDCFAVMRHALYNSTFEAMSEFDILNEWGGTFFSWCEWKFLERPPTGLDLVADQPYIELPANFGALMHDPVQTDSATTGPLKLKTAYEVLQLMAAVSTTSSPSLGTIYGVIVHDDPGQQDAVPVPRIQIWPVPSASVDNAYQIIFRAKWVDLTEPTSRVPIPAYLRSCFLFGLNQLALSYDEEGAGNMAARMAQVLANPLYELARRADARVQPTYGQLRNAPVQIARSLMGMPIVQNPAVLS